MASLIATIHKYRPDLISNKSTVEPIPESWGLKRDTRGEKIQGAQGIRVLLVLIEDSSLNTHAVSSYRITTEKFEEKKCKGCGSILTGLSILTRIQSLPIKKLPTKKMVHFCAKAFCVEQAMVKGIRESQASQQR